MIFFVVADLFYKGKGGVSYENQVVHSYAH